jgi:hypothetical protein
MKIKMVFITYRHGIYTILHFSDRLQQFSWLSSVQCHGVHNNYFVQKMDW